MRQSRRGWLYLPQLPIFSRDFEPVICLLLMNARDFPPSLQVDAHDVKNVKIVIQSAWNGDFAAIYNISVA